MTLSASLLAVVLLLSPTPPASAAYQLGLDEVAHAPARAATRFVPELSLRSAAHFSCLGYEIKTAVARKGKTITVTITGIAPPRGPCATALGPASGVARLDVPHGTYTVIVRARTPVAARGKADRYRLTVTDEALELVPEAATFTDLGGTSQLHVARLHRRVGVACGAAQYVWICDELLAQLGEALVESPFHAHRLGLPFPGGGLDPSLHGWLTWRGAGLTAADGDPFARAREIILAYARRDDRRDRLFHVQLLAWDRRQLVVSVGLGAWVNRPDAPQVEIREWADAARPEAARPQ